MDWDPYEKPARRASPAFLLLAVLVGITLGGLALYYFSFNKPAPNDPNAMPRTPEPRSEFDREESDAIRVFKSAKECVVNVDTIQGVRQNDLSVVQQQTGTGSGFVWDDAGRIVTNYHVIAAAVASRAKLRVVFADRTIAEAIIVGTAPEYDLAVIQVTAAKEKLKPIRVGTSKDLEVGQKVFAIGNPFGLSLTMTDGIISSLNREIESPGNRLISGAIQTNASINPGNSGGPLLDKDGRLIGVNTAIASPTGSSVGIGFAIPVDTVNDIVPKLIAGKLLRPDAGLTLVNPVILRQNRIYSGAMIAEVAPGGPADTAGLRGLIPKAGGTADPGDLILAINGVPVPGNVEYLRAIASKNVGDKVKFTIKRGEKKVDVNVTLRGI